MRGLLTILFVACLVLVGILRNAGFESTLLSPYAGYATPIYIAATVFFAVLLGRSGVDLRHVEFFRGPRMPDVVLAIAGVAALQMSGFVLDPFLEGLFGAGRDLGRFADIEGSLPALLTMLAISWTVAAFGEEIAFRVVLFRGIAASLGDGRGAVIGALVLQAVVFGLVHLYQGPSGMAGAMVSGLVFGVLVLLARGAIWPAALAHGLNNSIGLTALYIGSN